MDPDGGVRMNTAEALAVPEDSHQKLIDDLKQKREEAALGGGADRIEAQHAKGKLTARERITRLVDEDSFQEIDAFMLHRHSDFGMQKNRVPGDGMIAGFAKINGRRVRLYASDFTVLGASFSE